MTRRRRTERGQAMTETLLLTWILLIFIAAIYQLFLVNHAVFASLAHVHTRIFEKAFARNCPDKPECEYGTDLGGSAARVVWTPEEIPEINIPIVGMFRKALPDGVRLESQRYGVGGYDHACPDRPCKRTKLGSGTYKGPIQALIELPGIVLDDDFLSSYLDGLDTYLLQSILGGLLDSVFS
jgi:hypothetical protein